ncbi:hypothetical protein [uncultured Jannaschia sp.]|uniref:hypothetical protein n=1 Tax=uncultured Jannaschia sp. TaxID=293347 RepID=UPI00262CE152|nr:hypothetical protein [uncultured Jannaschia sp.]
MVIEPHDAPVPESSKRNYYIWLAVAIVLGGLLVVFVMPNLYYLTAEGPAVDGGFNVVVPEADGTGLANVGD